MAFDICSAFCRTVIDVFAVYKRCYLVSYQFCIKDCVWSRDTSGFGRLTGLTVGIFLTKVLLQQLTTGFYEELNYRFLLLEGLKYTANTTRYKLIYVFVSTVLFGLVHGIPSWDTYTFLTTGAIGFAFAVIYVKSGNIVLPMGLHFVYDFLIKMAAFVQWRPNPVYNGICDCADIA